jgi:hypothetical protein
MADGGGKKSRLLEHVVGGLAGRKGAGTGGDVEGWERCVRAG